jgi:hypothetical protein
MYSFYLTFTASYPEIHREDPENHSVTIYSDILFLSEPK